MEQHVDKHRARSDEQTTAYVLVRVEQLVEEKKNIVFVVAALFNTSCRMQKLVVGALLLCFCVSAADKKPAGTKKYTLGDESESEKARGKFDGTLDRPSNTFTLAGNLRHDEQSKYLRWDNLDDSDGVASERREIDKTATNRNGAAATATVDTRPEAAIHPTFCAASIEDCNVCTMGANDGPWLFLPSVAEGLGLWMLNLVFGMAKAAELNMRFGGIVDEVVEEDDIDDDGNVPEARNCDLASDEYLTTITHGVNVGNAAFKLFGLCDKRVLFPRRSVCGFDHEFASVQALVHARGGLKGNANVYLPNASPVCDNKLQLCPLESLLRSTGVLKVLRAQALPEMQRRVSEFSTDGQRPRVAVHVRRGDITKQHSRYLRDSFYVNIIEQVVHHLPDAEVHAWSSTEANYKLADFGAFEALNVSVHLDGDPLDAWAHFATADVFIMSQSGFSFFPALLNAGCVIHLPYTRTSDHTLAYLLTGEHAQFKTWLNPETASESDFAACLARVHTAQEIRSRGRS